MVDLAVFDSVSLLFGMVTGHTVVAKFAFLAYSMVHASVLPRHVFGMLTRVTPFSKRATRAPEPAGDPAPLPPCAASTGPAPTAPPSADDSDPFPSVRVPPPSFGEGQWSLVPHQETAPPPGTPTAFEAHPPPPPPPSPTTRGPLPKGRIHSDTAGPEALLRVPRSLSGHHAKPPKPRVVEAGLGLGLHRGPA